MKFMFFSGWHFVLPKLRTSEMPKQNPPEDISEEEYENNFNVSKIRNSILFHKTSIKIKRTFSLPAIGESEETDVPGRQIKFACDRVDEIPPE